MRSSPNQTNGDMFNDVPQITQEALNSKHPVHATRIEEGGDHKSWFIDNEYAMRFAIAEDASKHLLREIKRAG
ncbi:hypothetical protein PILCRDRAFT_822937 [Piloderma croceum F 1598]|uniref:Uncharacterized protein n=1 Tax=Piloderma croceum (strain F 1598) TaxID=765440 RepID=A0A0C3BS00_PILCF|nr:hypothetical protein PILCRDRAFT_822937 [Piloderma croceum F 1598]